MTKHTPGPWVANAKHCACANDAQIVIEQEGGSAPIAKAFQINGDQLHANARLIAAAPVLLAELENLMRLSVWKGASDYDRKQVERARAAIAKATGGAQ